MPHLEVIHRERTQADGTSRALRLRKLCIRCGPRLHELTVAAEQSKPRDHPQGHPNGNPKKKKLPLNKVDLEPKGRPRYNFVKTDAMSWPRESASPHAQ